MAELKTLGVIGAGQMGNGIAHVASQVGCEVVLYDIADDVLQKAHATIEKNMGREVKREKITEAQQAEALGRIRTTRSMADLSGAELIIEAATENEAVKQKIYGELVGHLKEGTFLASNTSSISITRLGANLPNPERFVGIHFFNPVPMMSLVEVIRGMATGDEAYRMAHDLVSRMGKTPVDASDSPGFIVNRIFCPFLNEAIYALYEGVGDVVSVDTAVRLGLAHPMGPLTLADYVGLDTLLSVMRVLHAELGDDKYRPCPLLVKYVEAGWLGVKTRRGFYDYTGDEPRPTR